MWLLIFVALIFGGFELGTAVDMRPSNTPHVHYVLAIGPFKIATIDWTAPESSYALGLSKGANLQKTADQKNLKLCVMNSKYLTNAVTIQNRAAQDAEDRALAIARAQLGAAQAARSGRARTLQSAQAIDQFHGRGTSCEQAEQLVRSVIQ